MAANGEQFDKEFEFSFGSVTIGMAEIVMNFAETDEPIEEILSEINSVQVGVYNNHSNRKNGTNTDEINFLISKMEKSGWDCIVRAYDRSDVSAVFVKMNEEELKQLYVISISNNEIVLVEILGNLHKVIEIAIREKGFDIANSY
jgi:hypothetical protein